MTVIPHVEFHTARDERPQGRRIDFVVEHRQPPPFRREKITCFHLDSAHLESVPLRLFLNQVDATNSNFQASQEAVMKKGLVLSLLLPAMLSAQQAPKADQVELQPLTAQVGRLIEAMDYLGAPIKQTDREALEKAGNETDAAKARRTIQDTLDKYCLFDIHINPESRVRVTQGEAKPDLVEKGWGAFLVKVRNEAGVTAQLKAESPNALPVYATSRGNPRPQQQVTQRDVTDRWLDLAMFNKPPLKPTLSGLELEYRVIQVYSRDAGKREAKISFNVGQGTQDIGFRNDVDVLFDCRPTADVTFRVLDEYGKPTTASFVIRDPQERVYPPRFKRLAPDFDFHPQVYRSDGEQIKLPTGEYKVEFTRGPE